MVYGPVWKSSLVFVWIRRRNNMKIKEEIPRTWENFFIKGMISLVRKHSCLNNKEIIEIKTILEMCEKYQPATTTTDNDNQLKKQCIWNSLCITKRLAFNKIKIINFFGIERSYLTKRNQKTREMNHFVFNFNILNIILILQIK